VDQAVVQLLLEQEVEKSITEKDISRSEIEKAYQKQLGRFIQPEKRASKHVLAKVEDRAPQATDDSAKKFIEKVVSELVAAKNPEETLSRYSTRSESVLTFTLVAEDVPPLALNDNAEKTYLDALFALPKPGVVPYPVRSGYGWHAIILTGIQPGKYRSPDQAEAELRRELVIENRRRRLQELTQELQRKIPVRREARAMDIILARKIE